MKIAKMFFVSVCLVFVSCAAFAANYCLNCFDQIDESEKYCVVCKAKLSVDELKTKEDQLIHAVTISRKNYRNTLDELRQYYQDTGNQLRLQKTRRELDALDKGTATAVYRRRTGKCADWSDITGYRRRQHLI